MNASSSSFLQHKLRIEVIAKDDYNIIEISSSDLSPLNGKYYQLQPSTKPESQ